jgi:uncharacterized repeat protein (TIGR01451 family)
VPLSNVRVEHALPVGAKCIGVLPRPDVVGGKLIWRLGTMEAQTEQRFVVRVEKGPGVDLPAETSAILHACYFLKAPVARPRLAATITGPDRVRVGESAVFHVEFKNTGAAPATNLIARGHFGQGLRHSNKNEVELNLGTLAAGESIQLKLTTTAVGGGTQSVSASLSAAENVQATAQCQIEITEPLLELHCPEPPRAFVGRPVRFTIEVDNPGTAPIGQSLIVETLPEDLAFLWASDAGEFDPSDRSITWLLGALEPGQSHSFIVEVEPKTPGAYVHRTLAWTDCGLEVQAENTLSAEIDNSLTSRLLEELLAEVDHEDEVAASTPLDELPATPVVPRSALRGSQYVMFTLRGADYAIALDNVLEYGHPLTVTPLPNVPHWLLGVANLHGDIVSMVDLRLFLGQERPELHPDGRLLVVRSRKEEITVGLIVDRVKGIRVVADDAILQPPSPVEEHLAPYIRGVASHNGRLIVLLNLDKLLLSSEMRQFEPV